MRALPSALPILLTVGTLGCGTPAPPDDGAAALDLLITDGIVVTMNAGREVFSPGAVAISGSEIVAVGPAADVGARYNAAATMSVPGRVVMPGLINTHTHAPMVMYRGLADDLALMEWLERYIFPAEASTVTADFVRVGTRLAALEMIMSGTTTFADMYFFEDAIAEVVREAGLRAVLGQTVIGFPSPDAATPAEGLDRARAFIERWQDDPLIVPAVAPHALYTLDAASLVAARGIADEYEAPLIIHLAETRDEVATAAGLSELSPTAYLDSLGVLGAQTLAAHAVWVGGRDIEILAEHDVGVAHNPESNMKLASGTAPVPRMLVAGLAVGLGTDGAASNNDLDLFEAMRQAAFLHKIVNEDPRSVAAPTALEMATIGGARALGLDDRIGSLEPGKRADLIVVSMDAPRQTPMYDPISHLVYTTRGDDVITTIVDGRVLMRDREVLTLEAEPVLNAARRLAQDVRAAVP